MSETEEIVAKLKEKQKLILVSADQEKLENLFDDLCKAGFRNLTMPLFEEELSKRELQRELSQCMADVHKIMKPLGKSILSVKQLIGENEGELISCELPYVEQLTFAQAEELSDVLKEYEDAATILEAGYRKDSWNGIHVKEYSEELRLKIQKQFPKLIQVLSELKEFQNQFAPLCTGGFLVFNWNHLETFISIMEKALRLQHIPADWIYQANLDELTGEVVENRKECLEYMHIRSELSGKYDVSLFDIDGIETARMLTDGIRILTERLRIHGQNDGFVLDNLRHIAERTDLLLGNLKLLQHDIDLIRELTGCEKNSAFENIPAFYQMADFLAHKPAGLKGTLSISQIQSANEAIRRFRQSDRTVAELERQLEFRYQDSFLELDAGFLMEQFGEHADIKKYMMGQKQLHKGDIENFLQEMEQGETLIRTSLEAANAFDCSAFQMPDLKYVCDIDTSLTICKTILGEVTPCDSWLDPKEREHILWEIEDCEQCCLQIKRITYQLLEVHNDQIFQIHFEDMLPRFLEDYQGIFKRLKGAYKQDRELVRQTYWNAPDNLTDEEIIRVLQTLSELQAQRENFRRKKAFLVENVGSYYHGENTNWGLLKADIRQFEEMVSYFDSAEAAYASIQKAKESIDELQKYYGTLMTLRNSVRERASVFYTGGEFEMTELKDVGERFEQLIVKARKMKQDFGNVCTYLKGEDTADVSYQEILHGIQCLDKWSREKKWLDEKRAELKQLFGEDFKGMDTDWEQIENRLTGMKNMYATVEKGMYGDELAAFLEDDTKVFSVQELSVQDYKGMLSKIETELKSFLQVESLKAVTLDNAAEELEKIKSMCMDMDETFANVSRFRNRREHAKNILEDMKLLAQLQMIEQKFSEDSQSEQEKYSSLYRGVASDWNAIADMLKLAKSMRSDVSKYHLSREAVEALLESEQSGIDLYTASNVLTGATIFQKEIEYASSLFAPACKLMEMEYGALYQKLSDCMEDIEELPSWIVYEQGKDKCMKHGLMSFISAVEKQKLEPNRIKGSFIKTFYTKWLESVMFEKGGLHPYRVKSYEELEEIERLDEEQKDLRTMTVSDYFTYVPNWLSNKKPCLLVKENTTCIPFYETVEL